MAGPLLVIRECQKINVSTSRQKTVVPVAMKFVSPELEFGHLLVRNFDPRRIGIGVEFALHRPAARGGSGGNQVDDDFVAHERFTPPVLADE